MAAVDEHGELDARGPPELQQRIDGSANRPPRIEHVVHEHDRLALEGERDARRPDHGLATRRPPAVAHVHVVAMEGDVERAELELRPAPLRDQAPQARGERDAASLDTDERDLRETVPVRPGRALDELMGDA